MTAAGQASFAEPIRTAPTEVEQFSPVHRTGVAVYRGRLLSYEVIGGIAVHDGDIVLGPVEEVVAHDERWRSLKETTGLGPVRRDISAVEEEHLWPNGIIPYEIDPGFNEQGLGAIHVAIDEWNSKTVITLVERTTEVDFVRFRPEEWGPSDGNCRSWVGRIGGEQSIWLIGADGCPVGSTVHEIGHAVGLWHENDRVDRDRYVAIHDTQAYGSRAPDRPAGGPYDYASIMHARGIESIPPGMPTRSDLLSAGDIDGVARLYGRPPTATTISTNPSSLAIIVDGESVVTPATFRWSLGSKHVIQAHSQQTVGGKRFVFGRWNDEAGRRRTVTAGPESTWFEGNYIVQQRLVACPDPAEAGEARIRPASSDGYYTIGLPVEIEAVPHGSHAFLRWGSGGALSRRPDRRSFGWSVGESSNPVSGSASPWWSAGSEYAARFTAKPRFLIDSNAEGVEILVNGETRRLPWAFAADAYADGITIEAPAIVPEETGPWTDVRYRFRSWSDGWGRIHRVAVPATGGSISLNVVREYRLRLRVRSRRDDESAVSISPPSEDGFYAAGTQVLVTALPSTDERFAGWTGEVSGSAVTQTVVMDAAKHLEAVFTQSEPLRPDGEQDVELAATDRFRLHNSGNGWNVLVPSDATEMTVRFQSLSSADVDLYVRRGREVWAETPPDGGTPRLDADFESTAPGANEQVTIGRRSTPPLANDVYYIGLAVDRATRRVRGKLSVEIRRSGIARAWPAAFTFVAPVGADAGSQTLGLTHKIAGPVRYRIESNRPWLRASPQEWVQTTPGSSEIAVAVSSAGMATGTHNGVLTILQVGGETTQGRLRPTGIDIPVAFGVVPRSGSIFSGLRVNGARMTSRPASGDTYGAGEEIKVAVDLVDPAEVSGNPTLALAAGNGTRDATWDGHGPSSLCGEAHKTLRFRYLVQAEDRDADGVGIPEDALAVNGGSFRAALGGPAGLAVAPVADDADHKVDGSKATAPRVKQVRIWSRPHDGQAYGAGEELSVQVEFHVRVEVTGSPTLALRIGNSVRHIPLASTSDWGISFRYAVQPGDVDPDGISIPANALALGGGSIRSETGADAELDLGSHAIVNDARLKVDGTNATSGEVVRVRITSSPSDGTAYAAGEVIVGYVLFNVLLEVTGSPTLALKVGSDTHRVALGWNGITASWFRYTVQAGDSDVDGISIPANALALNGGSIRSVAGAGVDFDLGNHAIADDAGHKVDGGG